MSRSTPLHRRDRLSSGPDPIDEFREQYGAGVIDETEFEQQVASYVDDRNERIRIVVEDVSGIAFDVSSASSARRPCSIGLG